MVLSVENISKKFGDVVAVENLSFDLERGKIISIIGKSGAGKTTALRCICTLETCQEGTIRIDENYLCKDDGNGAVFADDNTLKSIRKDIGLVFQNFNLFPHMSVLENLIESPVNVYKVNKKEAIEKANELLKLVELEDKSASYPSQLSGGQKQRVGIIRACMLEPKVLCFDEPTSALDPSLSNQVSELIKKIAKDQNLGVLIITHDMEFAKNTCDKYIRMENGKIVEEGHPDHV